MSDSIALFVRDASLDTLAFADAQVDGAGPVFGLDGPLAVVDDPFRDQVYIAAAESDSIAAFALDTAGDQLIFLGASIDGQAGVDGLDGAAALALSADGGNLYAAGRDEDAVAVFALPSGLPSPIQVVRNGENGVTGLDAPTALALSADGRYLYAAGAGPGSSCSGARPGPAAA